MHVAFRHSASGGQYNRLAGRTLLQLNYELTNGTLYWNLMKAIHKQTVLAAASVFRTASLSVSYSSPVGVKCRSFCSLCDEFWFFSTT